MPRRFYQHICRDYDLRTINWSPCNVCGAPGVYVGWGYSSIEHMGHNQRLYGLPPIGPHRPLVDGLRLAERCEACIGKGLFDIENGRDYASCAVCDGIGQRLVCTPEDLNAVQQIAWLIIDQHKQKPPFVTDGREPIDGVLGLIADESIRTAARRLLDERRFTDLLRILAWEGVLNPQNAHSVACDPDGKDKGEEGMLFENEIDDPDPGTVWDDAADGNSRWPGPPTVEDISRLLERLGQLNLLNSE